MRHARLAEALDIIRQLWTGEVVTYEGTYFTVHDAKLYTRPRTPPEILVSGFGPEATRHAAQIGQGWISASGKGCCVRQFSAELARALSSGLCSWVRHT